MAEVKCPKCRLRFTENTEAGMNQLACVCPRCGTPFTFDIPPSDSLSGQSAGKSPADSPSGFGSTDSPASRQHAPSPASSSSDDRSAGSSQGYVAGYPRRQQRRGCSRSCMNVLLFLFLFGAGAFLIADNLNPELGSEVINRLQDSEPFVSDLYRNDSPAPQKVPRKQPDWIQGHWHNFSEQGICDVEIQGNNILRVIDGDSLTGTFVYKRGYLRCSFSNGETARYKLDFPHKEIDNGERVNMKKR
ncbi:MAG: hypothetical protein IJ196_07135 [Prevotella sp.]|nr:hypothetical protein [Prevotella sp.]